LQLVVIILSLKMAEKKLRSFFYKSVIAVFHAEIYYVCRAIYLSLSCKHINGNTYHWHLLSRIHLSMGLILFRTETKEDGSSCNASHSYLGSYLFESQPRSWPPQPANSVVFPQALQLQPHTIRQIRPQWLPPAYIIIHCPLIILPFRDM
jgi:hypothetical protein